MSNKFGFLTGYSKPIFVDTNIVEITGFVALIGFSYLSIYSMLEAEQHTYFVGLTNLLLPVSSYIGENFPGIYKLSEEIRSRGYSSRVPYITNVLSITLLFYFFSIFVLVANCRQYTRILRNAGKRHFLLKNSHWLVASLVLMFFWIYIAYQKGLPSNFGLFGGIMPHTNNIQFVLLLGLSMYWVPHVLSLGILWIASIIIMIEKKIT